MSYLFGEGINEIFEEEEKRFQSEDSKVNFFTYFLEMESNVFLALETVETLPNCAHSKLFRENIIFSENLNLLHCNGTTHAIGYVIENTDNVMQVEAMDENDDIIIISAPEPQWDDERKCYVCDDIYYLDG